MLEMLVGRCGRSSPGRREATSHRASVLVALLACVLVASWSATASAQPTATFLVEKITVEGVSPGQARIVMAESLLKGGATYDEGELRDAVYRVKRLPFVLLADFSLRKGSVRGSYELIITVVATKRFFFTSGVSNWKGAGAPADHDEQGSVGFRQTIGSFGELFVQSSGILYTEKTGFVPSLQLGYNQYNLFGRGAVASLIYSQNDPIESRGRRSQQLSLELTVPFAGTTRSGSESWTRGGVPCILSRGLITHQPAPIWGGYTTAPTIRCLLARAKPSRRAWALVETT